MTKKEEILERLKFLKEQREIAYRKGLDTKIWDDEIKKIEIKLEEF